jgi:hypothetical protein
VQRSARAPPRRRRMFFHRTGDFSGLERLVSINRRVNRYMRGVTLLRSIHSWSV